MDEINAEIAEIYRELNELRRTMSLYAPYIQEYEVPEGVVVEPTNPQEEEEIDRAEYKIMCAITKYLEKNLEKSFQEPVIYENEVMGREIFIMVDSSGKRFWSYSIPESPQIWVNVD